MNSQSNFQFLKSSIHQDKNKIHKKTTILGISNLGFPIPDLSSSINFPNQENPDTKIGKQSFQPYMNIESAPSANNQNCKAPCANSSMPCESMVANTKFAGQKSKVPREKQKRTFHRGSKYAKKIHNISDTYVQFFFQSINFLTDFWTQEMSQN